MRKTSQIELECGWSESTKTIQLGEVRSGSYFMHKSRYDKHLSTADASHIFCIHSGGKEFSSLSDIDFKFRVENEADRPVYLLDFNILFTIAEQGD